MRRNSVTPLASPEPSKKPRINSFEEHVVPAASAALPIRLPQEVPTQLPGQVGYILLFGDGVGSCCVVLWLS